MPAPKGTRTVPFAIGSTDAVHIYSDTQRIWLQLRRDVPTKRSIAKPSFKVALTLTPQQASAIAGELLKAARKASPQSSGSGKQPPKPKTPTRSLGN
jgi:hypothetical protein